MDSDTGTSWVLPQPFMSGRLDLRPGRSNGWDEQDGKSRSSLSGLPAGFLTGK